MPEGSIIRYHIIYLDNTPSILKHRMDISVYHLFSTTTLVFIK